MLEETIEVDSSISIMSLAREEIGGRNVVITSKVLQQFFNVFELA